MIPGSEKSRPHIVNKCYEALTIEVQVLQTEKLLPPKLCKVCQRRAQAICEEPGTCLRSSLNNTESRRWDKGQLRDAPLHIGQEVPEVAVGSS